MPTLPAAVSAQSAGVYLDGAEPWTESDCAGDVPIVVGSDAKAQSDIYSAVTLAGVVDTDCVVLAGPRDGGMPAEQQARLDAAAMGGYVLGGTAAVPDAKIAGRDMTRLGGATRWETAQIIGEQARALAEDEEPGATSAPDTTLTAPSDVQQPSVFLDGAEPWIASDCAGDVPIVVGSDVKAQSDIYSAVTLAGVLGTDCVILAGPRDGAMAASQRARLAGAEAGGYVLGGSAAVLTAKIAGRDMTRLGGATRWATAQLVGRRASGDTTAGTSTSDEPIITQEAQTDTPEAVASVSGGHNFSCWLRTDRTIACRGSRGVHPDNAPSGTFDAVLVASSSDLICGIRTDRTITCWGNNRYGQAEAPSGTFTVISPTHTHACAIRTDRTITCWGNSEDGRTGAPPGTFTAVSAGYDQSCGLRTDRTITCWGNSEDGRTGAPPGTFTAVSAGYSQSCGLRTDRTITCWGRGYGGRALSYTPSGTFTSIDANGDFKCGVRTNGDLTCWTGQGQAGPTLSGTFDALSASSGRRGLCGLRTDRTITCTGSHGRMADAPPSGTFTDAAFGWAHSCGIGTDGTITCWGDNSRGQADAPSGTFTLEAARIGHPRVGWFPGVLVGLS